jgi:outer membrane lipoprotein-sorting protein
MQRQRRDRTLTLLLLGALALCAAARAHGAEPPRETLTAKQILARMGTTYARCRTYRDAGVATTVFTEITGRRTEKKPFTTAFVRPDRFRFEYREQKSDGRVCRYLVWRSGKDVRSWWDVRPGVTKLDSLGMALSAATGVSGGSAHTIPALLLADEVGGCYLTEITEAKRIEDAALGTVTCVRLQGSNADRPVTLWLDAATFLIRRIELRREFDTFFVEETTTYEPVINGEISQAMLAFDPPAQP